MALDLRPATTIAKEILSRTPTRQEATRELEAQIKAGSLGFEQAKAVDAAIDVELKRLSTAEQQRVGTQGYGAGAPTPTPADFQRSFNNATRGWTALPTSGPAPELGEVRGQRIAMLLNFDPPSGIGRFVEGMVLRAPTPQDERWIIRLDSGWVDFPKLDTGFVEARLEPHAPKTRTAFDKKYREPDWKDLALDVALPQLANQRETPEPGERIALYARHGRGEQRVEGTLVSTPRYPRDGESNADTLCWQLKLSDGSVAKVPRDDVLGVRHSQKERLSFDKDTQGWAEAIDELKLSKEPLVGKRVKALFRDVGDDRRLKILDAVVERPAVYGREADYVLKLKDGSTLSVGILELLKMRLAPQG